MWRHTIAAGEQSYCSLPLSSFLGSCCLWEHSTSLSPQCLSSRQCTAHQHFREKKKQEIIPTSPLSASCQCRFLYHYLEKERTIWALPRSTLFILKFPPSNLKWAANLFPPSLSSLFWILGIPSACALFSANQKEHAKTTTTHNAIGVLLKQNNKTMPSTPHKEEMK